MGDGVPPPTCPPGNGQKHQPQDQHDPHTPPPLPVRVYPPASLEGFLPKIGDFGLVCVADEVRLTQTGIITGTPMYMAPEQALCEPLDGRADLFSLGSLLYALCTGHEPFPSGSPLAVLRQVCESAPRPIREINPAIPTWLAAVIERLHAKNPGDRFRSASEVAELLRYNLEHPDRPRSVPVAQPRKRSRRWLSRSLGGVLLGAALLGGLVTSETLHWTNLTGWLAAEVNLDKQVTLRAELRQHQGPIWAVAFAPDGKSLATGGDDAILRFWDSSTGAEVGTLPRQNQAIQGLAFAHSGKFLVTGDASGALHLWDLATRKEGPALPPHTGSSRRMAISPDDRLLVIGSGQGVELLDLQTRKLRKTLSGHQGTVQAVALSPDGKLLASGDARGQILLWDASTGEPPFGGKQAEFRGDPLSLRSLAFTPDGRTLISAGTGEKTIKLWDVSTQKLSATLTGYENAVPSLAVSPHGRLLAGACRDGAVRFWDLRTGRLLGVLQAHQGVVWGVAFSPDGHTLATVSEGGVGKLWDPDRLAEGQP